MIGNTAPDVIKFMRDSGILAQTDAGDQIYLSRAPQNISYPLVILDIVGGVPLPTQDEGSAVDTYRIQCNTFAKNTDTEDGFIAANNIHYALRATWSRSKSNTGDYDNAIDSIQEDDLIQHDYLPDLDVHHVYSDYFVRVVGNGTTITTDGVIVVKSNKIFTKKVTLTYADFATAATTNTIDLWTLPAKGLIHMITGQASTLFSGGSISEYLIKIGILGELDKYIFDQSVFTGAAAPQAVMPGGSLESMSASTILKATATSTGANLNAATAGSITFWIYYSILN